MPGELVHRWGKATFDHYMQIYASRDAAEAGGSWCGARTWGGWSLVVVAMQGRRLCTGLVGDAGRRGSLPRLLSGTSIAPSATPQLAGVMLMGGYELSSTRLPDEPPLWADIVPTYRRLSTAEIQAYDPTGESVDGTGFTTIITEGRLYMAWLLKRIDAAGGSWEKRTIASLDELHGYDAVVNCTGLLASRLTGDKEMYPIRGHVLRVRAPWVRHYICKDKLTYIIPNTGAWDIMPSALAPLASPPERVTLSPPQPFLPSQPNPTHPCACRHGGAGWHDAKGRLDGRTAGRGQAVHPGAVLRRAAQPAVRDHLARVGGPSPGPARHPPGG